MKEDFDNIFKDKIGDELPFDFRPADWLAAEQELDKLMPIAAPLAPLPRFLTWHKWAVAATVLLLGSQLFLISELGKVKQEVGTLHQENAVLLANKKQTLEAIETPQRVVIQHDTLIKTVFIDVSTNKKVMDKNARGQQAARFDLPNFEDNGNNIGDQNEAVLSTSNLRKKQPLKINIDNNSNALNGQKIPLQTVENSNENVAKNKDFNKDKNAINVNKRVGDKTENAQNAIVTNAENKTDNVKNAIVTNAENKTDNVKNAIVTNAENKTDNVKNAIVTNAENKTDNVKNAIVTNAENKTERTVLLALPNAALTVVKSINHIKNWLDDAAFDAVLTSKPAVIKPIAAVPNGWEIAANTLFLSNEEHRRPREKGAHGGDERGSLGANLRLSYNLRRALRLSVDADFWGERHGKFDANGPPPNNKPPVPPDYDLVGLNQDSRSFQLRFGADYKTRQIISLQPFVGVGVAYQMRLDDNFEFNFKKNNVEIAPILVPNDVKFDKPFSVSLRAGVEGKLYRRLSWSVNLDAQKGGRNRQTWSSYFGLKYAL